MLMGLALITGSVAVQAQPAATKKAAKGNKKAKAGQNN